MFSYDVRVPQDRIAVVIGKDGKTKRKLQRETKTKITVDSGDGVVTVRGEDGVKLFTCQNIVKAIARGFNPEIALKLLKQDFAFELIDLTNYSARKNQQQRMKGRVIGTQGKSRSVIENLADAKLSVYGKTIGIIAPIDSIGIAKKAVEDLLDGATHGSVYQWLERKQREIRLARRGLR